MRYFPLLFILRLWNWCVFSHFQHISVWASHISRAGGWLPCWIAEASIVLLKSIIWIILFSTQLLIWVVIFLAYAQILLYFPSGSPDWWPNFEMVGLRRYCWKRANWPCGIQTCLLVPLLSEPCWLIVHSNVEVTEARLVAYGGQSIGKSGKDEND